MGTKAIPKILFGHRSQSRSLQRKAQTFRSILMRWARRHGRSFPWRSTSDPYKTLVAEIMLQRTRSEQVGPVYKDFVSRYPSGQTLARASLAQIREVLRPLGLAFRARVFMKLAGAILDKHGGKVPVQAEEAIKLPGAGPYAAMALDAFLGGRRLPVIDANIARVVSRVFSVGQPSWRYARAGDRRALYETTLLSMGRVSPRSFYYALLDFAAKVCAARKPSCPECPMHRAGICAYCADLRP